MFLGFIYYKGKTKLLCSRLYLYLFYDDKYSITQIAYTYTASAVMQITFIIQTFKYEHIGGKKHENPWLSTAWAGYREQSISKVLKFLLTTTDISIHIIDISLIK